jgi:hypothetical protein
VKHTQHVTEYTPRYDGRNDADEKRMLDEFNLIVRAKRGAYTHDGSGLLTLVTVRTYGAKRGNGSRNYVSIWVHASDERMSCAGHGSAGGYGYHRPSAAMQAALESAGIRLAQPIDGVGESAMKEAMHAIARHLGYTRGHIA